MQDEIGSLEKGKKADLIALDLDEIGWAPFGGQDFYAALVYAVSGYHVRDVMVNGRWVFRNNQWKTMDYAKARADLEAKHDELMQRIKNNKETDMKKILIDTDAGVDDAQAILLAFGQKDVKIEAFTTVCGQRQRG